MTEVDRWILGLPTWPLIRSLGLASFGLLALCVISGMVSSMPMLKPSVKAVLYNYHTVMSVYGFAFGLLHGMLLAIDRYMPFRWAEIFVPFADRHFRLADGLGTLAVYIWLAVLWTSDFRHRLTRRVWRMVHVSSYAMFAFALVHGLLVGTDSRFPAAKWFYGATAFIVLALGLVRTALVVRKKRCRIVDFHA